MTFCRSSGVTYDADATTYFAAIVSAGSTISDANKSAVDAFIVGCKADGIWTAIKAACLLAGADSLVGALVPLVGSAPTNTNFVSGDYSRTTGLLGDGTTKYINSNRACNADPQDSSHITVYCHTAVSGAKTWIGGATLTNGKVIQPNTTTNVRFAINGLSISRTFTASTVTGLIGASRSSSSNVNTRISASAASSSNTSGTPLSETGHIFGRGATNLCDGRLSFYSIGENLDLALLDSHLVTYMAALT